MLDITYDFEVDGTLREEAFLDEYQVSQMFEQTKRSLEQSLRSKLEGLECREHHEAPRITIVGRYDAEREEMDIRYHVDTCCKLFLAQVIKMLNH